jgi:uncharacterized membrane protein
VTASRGSALPSLARPARVVVRVLLVGVAVAPFIPELAAHFTPLTVLARPLDAWFALQCERDPARMLGVGAVCARCLGIYVGLGLGALIARPRLDFPRLELTLVAVVALLLLDVASEALGWRGASAPLRLATGFGLGYVAGVVVATRWLTPHPTETEYGVKSR